MRINRLFYGKKSKAQHVVELALLMPFFIILFSYTFQFMVETYSKYKFSYIFASSVRSSIENQMIFDSTTQADAQSYDFRAELENVALNALQRTAYSNITMSTIDAVDTIFAVGGFQFTTKVLFFGEAGREYFYYIIPVNAAFIRPQTLNKTSHEVDSFFNWYYKTYAVRYFESSEEELEECPTELDENGNCVVEHVCDAGYQYDAESGECASICQEGEEFDAESGECRTSACEGEECTEGGEEGSEGGDEGGSEGGEEGEGGGSGGEEGGGDEPLGSGEPALE